MTDKTTQKIKSMHSVNIRSKSLRENLPDILRMTEFLSSYYKEVTDGLRVYCIRNDILSPQQIPKCEICSSMVKLTTRNMRFSHLCDNRECKEISRLKKYTQTSMHKYGTTNPSKNSKVSDKRKSTCNANYGVEHPMQSKLVVDKKSDTMQRKYGVTSLMQIPSFRLNLAEHMQQRYGVDNYAKTEQHRSLMRVTAKTGIAKLQSARMTRLNHDGMIDKLDDCELLKVMVEENGVYGTAEILGCNHQTVYNRLHQFGIVVPPNSSSYELTLSNYLSMNGIQHQRNVRNIISSELDIYISSHKLAIEIHGLRWHSTKYNKKSTAHLHKTVECNKLGIRLIQIFEDEWLERREQVLRKIKYMLGISSDKKVNARKTKIAQVGTADAKNFFDSNHIQGWCWSSLVFGLYFEEELVSAIAIRLEKDSIYIARYATNAIVRGGFSKLLKHVCSTYRGSHSRVTTFADIRWSDGGLYENNGFVLDYQTRPNYTIVVGKKRIRKEHYRKKKLASMPIFEKDKSEQWNTEANGLYRIYDCGLLKYTLALD